jgi:hypothetical protein
MGVVMDFFEAKFRLGADWCVISARPKMRERGGLILELGTSPEERKGDCKEWDVRRDGDARELILDRTRGQMTEEKLISPRACHANEGGHETETDDAPTADAASHGASAASNTRATTASHFYRALRNPGSGHKNSRFLSDSNQEIRAPRAPACRGPSLSSNSKIFSSAC